MIDRHSAISTNHKIYPEEGKAKQQEQGSESCRYGELSLSTPDPQLKKEETVACVKKPTVYGCGLSFEEKTNCEKYKDHDKENNSKRPAGGKLTKQGEEQIQVQDESQKVEMEVGGSKQEDFRK